MHKVRLSTRDNLESNETEIKINLFSQTLTIVGAIFCYENTNTLKIKHIKLCDN